MALRLETVARSPRWRQPQPITLRVPFSKALGLSSRLQGVVERQRLAYRFIMMMKRIVSTMLHVMIPPLCIEAQLHCGPTWVSC